MRKTISLMLAAVMLLCIGVPSSATEAAEPDPGIITAGYVSGATGGELVSVEIGWTDMNFTYYGESQAVWDPKTHTYSEAKPAAWANSTASISVTNHSNVVLKADINYTMEPQYDTMKLAFTDAHPFIGSAYTAAGEGKECVVTIRTVPTGSLPVNTPLGTEVGEIKVTVTSVDDYGTVFEAISNRYTVLPVNPDGLDRGDVYFESSDDFSTVDDAYMEMSEIVSGGTKADYENNYLFNEFLALYYEKLQILQ